MPCYFTFTSFTWDRDCWGKTFYLCEPEHSEKTFMHFHFTSNKAHKKIVPYGEALDLKDRLPTKACLHVA